MIIDRLSSISEDVNLGFFQGRIPTLICITKQITQLTAKNPKGLDQSLLTGGVD